jgi:hypothetical protein
MDWLTKFGPHDRSFSEFSLYQCSKNDFSSFEILLEKKLYAGLQKLKELEEKNSDV